jgi:hypothetical protein
MRLKLIFVFLSLCGMQYLYPQELAISVLGSAGEFKLIADYSLSWTLGEVMTETFYSDNISLTNGFQQPDLSTGSGLPDHNLDWLVSVYPNPVRNYLTIRFHGLQDDKVIHVALIDIMGRTMILDEINNMPGSFDYSLNMATLGSGIYILRVYTTDLRMQRLFKIEKQ